jgi:NADPH-dependent ferric siderophore reductase
MPASTATTAARPQSRVRSARVKATYRLTPEMIRVVLDGPDLLGLPLGEYTDAYVKLAFPPAGAPYTTAEEYSEVREGLDPQHRPSLRTYTVRAYDEAAAELTLDFVYHGDKGLAGPWAAAARPGDEVIFLGPGGGYAPNPDADWHLLVGDESALPAIATALERIPAGVPVHAFVEVADGHEEQPLVSAADLHLSWVHRDTAGGVRGDALVDAVRTAELPDGQVHAFLHGEAGFVKQLRHHLRFERGVPKEMLSVSGYWRLGRDDEGWRAEKAAWKSEVEADEQANAS